MYEFHPYFTNDGSVGLYSPKDDDIYHSTYGALSEAYEKFIEPSEVEEFLKNNTEVKVLDICFGIGYNTKSFLNTFLEILKSPSQFSLKKNSRNFSKNYAPVHHCIAAIDTDNILTKDDEKVPVENPKNLKKIKNVMNLEHVKNSSLQKIYKIKIDLIDTDETLLALSPLIATEKPRGNYKLPTGLTEKIQKLNKKKTNSKYKLKKEVSIILFKKIIEGNFSLLESKNIEDILSKKETLPFFDKFMLNLIKFKQKRPYKPNKRLDKGAFLHNIYYQYLSPSYKRAEKTLKKHQIEINTHINDARITIKTLEDKYHFIFLDAFTPSKCPCLWTFEFFNELYKRLDDNGRIVTYSNSVAIRSAFIQAEFYVGKIKSKTSGKFIGTIATKNKSLIENPLTDYDLGLINSKAGICYKDIGLNLDNGTIIKNRELELLTSDKISSSQFIKKFDGTK